MRWCEGTLTSQLPLGMGARFSRNVPGGHWATVSAWTGRSGTRSWLNSSGSSSGAVIAATSAGGNVVVRVRRDVHHLVQRRLRGWEPECRVVAGGTGEMRADGRLPILDAVPPGDVDDGIRRIRLERAVQAGAAEPGGLDGRSDDLRPVGDEPVDGV